jgi:uncharacterized membrane protein YwaF
VLKLGRGLVVSSLCLANSLILLNLVQVRPSGNRISLLHQMECADVLRPLYNLPYFWLNTRHFRIILWPILYWTIQRSGCHDTSISEETFELV